MSLVITCILVEERDFEIGHFPNFDLDLES